jgi:hypothetical protein
VKDLDRPPVPPLGEAAIARIERGVFAALDLDAADAAADAAARPAAGRWRRRAVAVAAVAALALVGARELGRGGAPPARGARIATAASPSHLTIEGAAVDVAPSSAVSFATEHDGTTVVRLERGAVTCEVAPRSYRAPFVVEAGSTRVTVIGTRFSVERAGDHASVWVEHGTVEVGDDGLTQLVHAGERYRPGDGRAAATVAPEAAPAPEVAPAAAAPAAAAAPVAPAKAVAATEPAPARAKPQQRPRRAPAELALAAPSREPTPAPEPVPAPPPVEPVPAPEPAQVRAAAPLPAPPPSLQRQFETAAGLEVRDPEGALRVYAELSTGGDAWAANALFASARLEAERKHHDRARALLDAYLRRFPRGANAADARALLTKLDRIPDATP